MYKSKTLQIASIFPVALAASATTGRADVPSVAVDIAPVHSLVAQVMGDLGTPSLIVRPGASPHGYSMRPSEARTLQEAELVVWVGEELAPWLTGPIDALAEDATTLKLLDASGLHELTFRTGATFDAHDHGDDEHGHGHGEAHAEAAHDHDHEHGEEHAEASHDHDHEHGEEHAEAAHDHDHEHGEEHAEAAHDHDHEHGEEHAEAAHDHDHDHGEEHADAGHDHDHGHDHAEGGLDPHAWLSPENAAVWLSAIADGLSDLDPENAATYAANAEAAVARLDALEAEVAAALAPAVDMPFVVFHDAYQYFEDAFGIAAVGAISIGDASAPSAGRLREINDRIESLGAVCIGIEPQVDPDLAQAVATDDVRIAVMDPLGVDLEVGPDLYDGLLLNLAQSLAECAASS